MANQVFLLYLKRPEMKTIAAVLIVFLSIGLIACDTNMEDPLSLDDIAALAGMEAAAVPTLRLAMPKVSV